MKLRIIIHYYARGDLGRVDFFPPRIILIVISAVILIALASIALYFLVDIKKNIHDTKNVKTDDTLPQNVVVTASDGKFYLNGQSKPRITLKKGVTYTFNQSDPSNNNHGTTTSPRRRVCNIYSDSLDRNLAYYTVTSGKPQRRRRDK